MKKYASGYEKIRPDGTLDVIWEGPFIEGAPFGLFRTLEGAAPDDAPTVTRSRAKCPDREPRRRDLIGKLPD